MTSPYPSDADEIVSAYIDGMAAPDDVDRVESDPELLARVAELRAVSERLAPEPNAVSPELRDAHIAAALGEFDKNRRPSHPVFRTQPQPAAATPTAQPVESPEPVVSLSAERERRRPVGAIAAIAAMVAFVAAMMLLFGPGRSSSTEVVDAVTDTATSASSDAAATFESAASESAPIDSDAIDSATIDSATFDSDDAADEVAEESVLDDEEAEPDLVDDDAAELAAIPDDDEAGAASAAEATAPSAADLPGADTDATNGDEAAHEAVPRTEAEGEAPCLH